MVLEVDCSVEWNVSCGFFLKSFYNWIPTFFFVVFLLFFFHFLAIFLIITLYGILFQEAYGRYLDLHELYNQYINSKFGKEIEYSAYLDVFSRPHEIPHKLKMTR